MKKKKSLTFLITLLIISIILPLNILLLIATGRMMRDIENQAKMSMQNTADVYMKTLDMQMQQTGAYLYMIYTSDANMQKIRANRDELEYQNAYINCQLELNREVARAGICDAYFFFQPSTENFILGTSSELLRNSVRGCLTDLLPNQMKWETVFVDDVQYAIRITKLGDMFYGAMINLDQMVSQIYKSLSYSPAQVYFDTRNIDTE